MVTFTSILTGREFRVEKIVGYMCLLSNDEVKVATETANLKLFYRQAPTSPIPIPPVQKEGGDTK